LAPGKRARRPSAPDPFGERPAQLYRERLHVLGGLFEFESNSRLLLRLVRWAYAGLPRHRLSASTPTFCVRVMLAPEPGTAAPGEPPALQLHSGAGFLGAVTGRSTCVTLSETQQSALVVVSPDMLEFPYHIRYELIEFTVFTLATRAQRLAPLHAACIGRKGRGLLLVGESGAGKSTLTLHCLLNGFDFVAEDSVFVQSPTLLATGVGNFLHVRADSLRFLTRTRDIEAVRRSPVIRRRSGVEKFEVDVRRQKHRIAPAPVELAAVVFASSNRGDTGARLQSLRRSDWLARLNATQPYGTSRPEWGTFRRSVSRLPAFELYRGEHPADAIPLLRELLA
jgi:hypothetical protein